MIISMLLKKSFLFLENEAGSYTRQMQFRHTYCLMQMLFHLINMYNKMLSEPQHSNLLFFQQKVGLENENLLLTKTWLLIYDSV